MLAWHLAARYLRRRRAAWLALAAIAGSVAVSVVVVGITQGWLDQVERSFRANEAELTARCWDREADTPAARAELAAVPGIVAVAPYVQGYGIMGPRSDSQRSTPVIVDAVDLAADLRLGRLHDRSFHPPPITDLGAPDVPPEERGSGFLTREGRDDLALAGLDLAAGLGGLPLAPPPRTRPAPGIVAGREVLYGSGMRLGERVQIALPGSGSRPATIIGELSDTVTTGVLQVDQHLVVLPLTLGQKLTDRLGGDGRPGRVDGYRLGLAPGSDPAAVGKAVRAETGLAATTWQQARGVNAVRMIESNRNLVVVMMIAIEALCILFVYSVFSTLVVEKRKDFGVLICLGARRGDLAGAVLLMGLAAGVAGGLAGWAVGWGVLAVINPISEACGIPLFPMEIFYSAEAPISFNPLVPAGFAGLMVVIGLLAALLPALAARSTDPIATVKESG
jgi:ABC-type lipoprotein release transport system permease subunit